MKHNFKIILQYIPWLLLLLGIDAFSALLLWLADIRAFYSMIVVILLATILLFAAICFVLIRRENKSRLAFSSFLDNPDEYHEELLLKTLSSSQKEDIHLLGQLLRNKQNAYNNLCGQLDDYEEYVESWAHETKTPLSLLTLLLDNRRDELPVSISLRLDYIRNRLQESIDQMLYYARLKNSVKDYLFEFVSLHTCIEEVLEDYRPLMDEKHFQIHYSQPDYTVYADQRGLRFLFGQVISNSVKYCGPKPELFIDSARDSQHYILNIRDNGPGVRRCDLPYIFEKGFTGDSGTGRKKATGMGLYLAREIAAEMNLSLTAKSEWGKGFEITVYFPIVIKK